MQRGIFVRRRHLSDHLRRTSRFVDHQNIAPGCINIERMLTNGGSAWYVENVPRISKVLDGGLLGDGRYLIHDRRPSRLRSQYCLASAIHFRRANAKTPALSGGGSWLREPDDYLLSHGNPHYHRRRVVSRSCSGWEGVGPTRYGHQAKRVVALLRSTTNLGRSSNLGCVYHTRESNLSLWIAASAFTRRRSTRQTCYRIKPYGQLVSVS